MKADSRLGTGTDKGSTSRDLQLGFGLIGGAGYIMVLVALVKVI